MTAVTSVIKSEAVQLQPTKTVPNDPMVAKVDGLQRAMASQPPIKETPILKAVITAIQIQDDSKRKAAIDEIEDEFEVSVDDYVPFAKEAIAKKHHLDDKIEKLALFDIATALQDKQAPLNKAELEAIARNYGLDLLSMQSLHERAPKSSIDLSEKEAEIESFDDKTHQEIQDRIQTKAKTNLSAEDAEIAAKIDTLILNDAINAEQIKDPVVQKKVLDDVAITYELTLDEVADYFIRAKNLNVGAKEKVQKEAQIIGNKSADLQKVKDWVADKQIAKKLSEADIKENIRKKRIDQASFDEMKAAIDKKSPAEAAVLRKDYGELYQTFLKPEDASEKMDVYPLSERIEQMIKMNKDKVDNLLSLRKPHEHSKPEEFPFQDVNGKSRPRPKRFFVPPKEKIVQAQKPADPASSKPYVPHDIFAGMPQIRSQFKTRPAVRNGDL